MAQDTTRVHIPADSVSIVRDSLSRDSSNKASLEDSLGIRLSPDALPDPVTTTASDSAVLDMKNHLFYLYGSAKVNYQDLELNAPRVVYSQDSGLISAFPASDSLFTDTTKLSFKQGNELFYYDSLQYNFNTKRALVRNARTQYGDGFIISQQVKRNPDQSIFGLRSVYTTCSLDTPHYGIRAKHIKVVPGHIAVSGAANLQIEGVPTPIFLPFGLFPITQGQRSGFKLPTYTIEEQRGLALTNGGYYFYISDHVDLLLTGSIYSKGSWNASGISTYSKRYHYNGSVGFSYAYNKTGESYEPGASISRTYWLNWNHHTDAKARPGESFTAAVSAGSSNFFSLNSYNVDQIVNNQYSSNISWSKTWLNRPMSLSISARHSQNTQTRQYDVTIPELNFSVSQLTPFANKNRIGNARWYEKITTGYTLSALAKTTFYDTAFSLNTIGFNDFRKGASHSIPVSAAYTLFRFINVSFNADYKEYWLSEKLFQFYDPVAQRIDSNLQRGFFAARDFAAGASISTRIYGTKFFKHGRIAGIRHVLEPHAGFGYVPDYAASPFGYYYQTSLNPDGNLEYRSPYESSIIGVPGRGQFGDYSSSVSFGLNNNLQIKVRQKSKDSTAGTTKNISLIDGLSIVSAYNLAADSFNWSPLSLDFRTNIVNLVNVTAGAVFDPYAYDHVNGRRTSQTLWNAGKGLARFQNAHISLSAGFHSKPDGSVTSKTNGEDVARLMSNGRYADYVDFNVPWNVNFSYSLSLSKVYRPDTIGSDTLTYSQNFLFNGDFNLTPRWKMAFNSGYDFTNHSLTITSLDIYRDLHCMEMRLHTIPFGFNKSFNFTLNIKASVLQDLRLIRRRDYRDAL